VSINHGTLVAKLQFTECISKAKPVRAITSSDQDVTVRGVQQSFRHTAQTKFLETFPVMAGYHNIKVVGTDFGDSPRSNVGGHVITLLSQTDNYAVQILLLCPRFRSLGHSSGATDTISPTEIDKTERRFSIAWLFANDSSCRRATSANFEPSSGIRILLYPTAESSIAHNRS
jgi:hypothetical protein